MCKHSVNTFRKRLLAFGLSEVLHNFANFEQEVIERELLFGESRDPRRLPCVSLPQP